MKKVYLEQSRKAFTLTELLIAISILVVIIVMGAAFANYTAGNLKSSKTIKVNEAIRNTFDLIGQNINQANAVADIPNGASPSIKVYGFRVYVSAAPATIATTSDSNPVLVIVSNGGATCTFFGVKTNLMATKQNTCNGFFASTDLDEFITPSTIQINRFRMHTCIQETGCDASKSTLLQSNVLPANANIPRVTMDIVAQEVNNSANNIDLKNTFILDYQAVKRMAQ